MAKQPAMNVPEPWLFSMIDLVVITRLSETTIREMIRQGRFPRPVYPVAGRARWTRAMLEAWQAALEYLPAIGGKRDKEPAASTAAQPSAEAGKGGKPPKTTPHDRA